MRNQLLDILRYSWYTGQFEFLNFYHIKDTVIEIIPDLYGKITEIDPRTNQLVTTKALTPWLELGMPVRFSTTPDGSSQALTNSTLDSTKTYYINTLWGEDHCYRFTIGETPVSSDIVELPFSHFDVTIIHDRSYLVIKDPSFLDLNMKIVFENLPIPVAGVTDAGLSLTTKYYVDSFHPDNKIRINAAQSASDFVHFTTAYVGAFEIIQDNTFLEGVSQDKKTTFVGQTDEKITALQSDFGADNLGKLWEELLNTIEYPTNSNIVVTNVNENNNFVSTNIAFATSDNVFRDDFPLIHKDEVPKYHPIEPLRDIEWNITFAPSDSAITRFQKMYKTYDEFQFFDLYTKKIETVNAAYPALPHYELEFEFGMDNPKLGNLIFEPTITGTYVPRIIYEFTTLAEPIAYYEGLVTGVSKPKQHLCEKIWDGAEWVFQVEDTSMLKTGMPIQFENPPDSAQALGQAGLEYQQEYFVVEIKNCQHFTVGVNPDVAMPHNGTRTVDFVFYLLVQDYSLEMEDVIEPKVTTHQSRKLLHWIEPGMSVYFVNAPDSSMALIEAQLDPYETYYIKDVYTSNTLLRDAVTKRPIPLNKNTGEPIEDLLNPEARFPDKNNRPVVTEEEVIMTRFTISATPGGDTIELPFCNFEFFVRHEVNEIHIDDTRWFQYKPDFPIQFKDHTTASAVEAAGLTKNKRYYVHSILSKNRLKIKETPTSDYFHFNHTIDKCLQRHDTGNGLLWVSYPRYTNPTSEDKEPVPYTRSNYFAYEINPIPQFEPYTFSFGGVTVKLTDDSLFGPYYIADDDYLLGRS